MSSSNSLIYKYILTVSWECVRLPNVINQPLDLMKYSRLKLSSIKYRDGREGNRGLSKLAQCLDVEALRMLLKAHPLLVVDAGKENFRLISGEDRFRLARGLFEDNEMVPVLIVGSGDDLDVIVETETLVAPFVLGTSRDELLRRAETAITKNRVRNIARSLNSVASWKKLVDLRFERRGYRRGNGDPIDDPSDEEKSDHPEDVADPGHFDVAEHGEQRQEAETETSVSPVFDAPSVAS